MGENWGQKPPHLGNWGAPRPKGPPWTRSPLGWSRDDSGLAPNSASCSQPRSLLRQGDKPPGTGRPHPTPAVVRESSLQPHTQARAVPRPPLLLSMLQTSGSVETPRPRLETAPREAWSPVSAHLPVELRHTRASHAHDLHVHACVSLSSSQCAGQVRSAQFPRAWREAGSRPPGAAGQDWAPRRAAGVKPESRCWEHSGL